MDKEKTKAETMTGENSDYDVIKGYLDDLRNRYNIVIPSAIEERLRELEKYTEHNRDARIIYSALFEIFHLRRKKGHSPRTPDLSETDLGVGLAATLLHDVGKDGPSSAGPRRRKLISRLYSLEILPNGDSTSLEEAISLIIGEEAHLNEKTAKEAEEEKKESYFELLQRVGLRPGDSITSLWRQHSKWTREILLKNLDQANPLNRRIIKIASSHHYFEGSNYEAIDFLASDLSEEERKDIYLIKLLIILDQYQGRRRRGKKTPAAAFEYLREKLAKHGLENDADFAEILTLVQEIEEKTGIFKLGIEIDAEIKK